MNQAWLMVAVTFLTHFLAMGFVFYSMGVFLTPLADEFGTGRTDIATISSITSIGGGIAAPFLGRWLATGSIRNAMTIGCVALGGAFLIGAQATALWQLFVLFAPLATVGMMTMGGVTTQTLVVNWFAGERGMALGVSMFGISASGFVIPPIVTAITEAEGWRAAYESMGYACLAIAPIVFFTVVSRPSEAEGPKLEHVDIEVDDAKPPAPASPAPAFSTREALGQRNLWTVSIASGLSFMVTSAVMLHIYAAGEDSGLDPAGAALLISSTAAGAAFAKIFFGWLSGQIGELRSMQISLAAQGVGVLLLNQASGLELFIAVAVMTGVGLGGVAPLAAGLLARAFGQAAFGPMMGLMTPIMIPFQASGGPIAAAVFDQLGNYTLAWNGAAIAMLVAVGTVSMTRLPSADVEGAVTPSAQEA